MILADTNIFLEILLKQKKSEVCKAFLIQNASSLFMSDFSLHSIGVILLKKGQEIYFASFSSTHFQPFEYSDSQQMHINV
jgi:predicted nucleic acid-binding protein